MNDLFSDYDPVLPAVKPRDPSVPHVAQPRLNRQCQEILEMLRRGRATNSRLNGISLKYTGRISDLRKWFQDTEQGHLEIRVVEHDRRTGHVVYALFDHGQEVGTKSAGV